MAVLSAGSGLRPLFLLNLASTTLLSVLHYTRRVDNQPGALDRFILGR